MVLAQLQDFSAEICTLGAAGMPCEQELAQEKVRGGAVDGIWVIRSPWLSSLSLHFLSGLI